MFLRISSQPDCESQQIKSANSSDLFDCEHDCPKRPGMFRDLVTPSSSKDFETDLHDRKTTNHEKSHKTIDFFGDTFSSCGGRETSDHVHLSPWLKSFPTFDARENCRSPKRHAISVDGHLRTFPMSLHNKMPF